MPLKIFTEQEMREIDEDDEQLKQLYPVTAAGGLVVNDEGCILMIFRRNKWDLPKGKREDNEPVEVCAEREIKEETGLTELVLQRFLVTTYHTYTEKNQSILKDTHWFLYKAPGIQPLSPQSEEDISRAEWIHPSRLSEYMANTFLLIREVLKEAGFERQMANVKGQR